MARPKKQKDVIEDEELDFTEDVELEILDEDIEPIVAPKVRKNKKETEIYIRPEEMWDELRNYYLSLGDNYDWTEQKIKDKNDELYPPFPLRLASMINEIAERMTYLPNFVRYSWKSEMVGDAVLKMVKAVRDCSFKGYSTDKIVKTVERNGKNYFYHYDRRNKLREKHIKPDATIEERDDGAYITYKSDPFNYYTGICANSFINRIKKENQAKDTLDAYQVMTWDRVLATEQYQNVRRPKVMESDENESFYEE
jgi:hypothetical protein